MPTRRTFLEASLAAGAALTVPSKLMSNPGATPGAPLLAGVARGGDLDFPPTKPAEGPQKPPFPVHDYHVHLSNTLTIDQALQLAKDRGVQIGILEHPGPGYPINTDADLQH